MKQVLKGYALKSAKDLLKPAILKLFDNHMILPRRMEIDACKITVTIEYERLKK